MSEKAAKNKDALRITQQFRSGRAMVYDLREEGHRLTVRVFPRESPADLAEWRVEASAGPSSTSDAVSEWGATRTAALHEVGCAWTAKAEGQGLHLFDWKAVQEALLSVRAI